MNFGDVVNKISAQNREVHRRKIGIVTMKLPKLYGRGERKKKFMAPNPLKLKHNIYIYIDTHPNPYPTTALWKK